MNGHHLILGETVDVITGERLPDTHDERYRQKIARYLMENKGYPKTSLTPRRALIVSAGAKKAAVTVALTVHVNDKTAMIIHYGPGSIVTRSRPALAMGRLVAPYQVPVIVVTNGEEAHILNGSTGRLAATGLDRMPSYEDLADIAENEIWSPLSSRRTDLEARIVVAYEIDDRCPCDTDICRFVEQE